MNKNKLSSNKIYKPKQSNVVKLQAYIAKQNKNVNVLPIHRLHK